MQNQVVCNGCMTLLLYPRGATNICCAICSTITSVHPNGMEMARLICGGCRTLLIHPQGATSVRCYCCRSLNLVQAVQTPPLPNGAANINCGNCRTMLMYPAGAPSVKCAICQFITNVGASESRPTIPVLNSGNSLSTTTATSRPKTQTVVVKNPMTVDESGKLVSSVVVGVTNDGR